MGNISLPKPKLPNNAQSTSNQSLSSTKDVSSVTKKHTLPKPQSSILLSSTQTPSLSNTQKKNTAQNNVTPTPPQINIAENPTIEKPLKGLSGIFGKKSQPTKKKLKQKTKTSKQSDKKTFSSQKQEKRKSLLFSTKYVAGAAVAIFLVGGLAVAGSLVKQDTNIQKQAFSQNLACNEMCGSDIGSCGAGLACVNPSGEVVQQGETGRCRNVQCSENPLCTCESNQQENTTKATENSILAINLTCNESCGTNAGTCAPGLSCVDNQGNIVYSGSGMCKNPACIQASDCECSNEERMMKDSDNNTQATDSAGIGGDVLGTETVATQSSTTTTLTDTQTSTSSSTATYSTSSTTTSTSSSRTTQPAEIQKVPTSGSVHYTIGLLLTGFLCISLGTYVWKKTYVV